MAVDAFLYFKGGNPAVEGESKDVGMRDKKPFEINSYSFGVENAASLGSKSGGAGVGKANFDNFEFTKNIDTGSAYLFLNCCKGAHFTEAYLCLRRAGGKKDIEPYLIFEFKLIFLTGVKWSGSGDDVPEETVTFAYGAMQISYILQNSAGASDKGNSPPPVAWSVVVNQPSMEI